MTFICRVCKLEDRTLALEKLLEKTLEDNSQLQAKVKELSNAATKSETSFAQAVKSTQERLGNIETEHRVIQESKAPATLTVGQINQAASEIQEIERRKFNVVIAGLPETENDTVQFLKIANEHHILSSPLAADDIVDIQRLGKKRNDKIRLLKIRFLSLAKKRMILNMHRYRHNSLDLQDNNEDLPIIFVRPDLTKAQQAADTELRNELQRKGATKFRISKGKIIPRLPLSLSNNATSTTGPNTDTSTDSKTTSSGVTSSRKVVCDVPRHPAEATNDNPATSSVANSNANNRSEASNPNPCSHTSNEDGSDQHGRYQRTIDTNSRVQFSL